LIFFKDYYNFDGVYIGCNDAFTKFVGKTKEEILGKTDFEIFDQKTAEFFRNKDDKMLEKKKSKRNEEWVKYPDGTEVFLDVLKTPLYNFDGSILGVLGFARDITEKFYAQKEIEEKNRQIQEQTKLAEMGEMISNIAHQWRQPLSVISTAATGSLMEKKFGVLEDKELEKRLTLINENAQYLSETINTFRDFIREKKEYKEVILQERIAIAISIVKASLDNNYIKLINNIEGSEPIPIKLIAGEFTEVIINILNNAKDALKEKHLEHPWVQLDIYKDSQKATITIEDNAGGVPLEYLSKIFDPYFTTKHPSVGTGLGLHICYKIVTESLNGKIYVKNTKNGAKFFIELPLS
jgi:PAS domain S-box-containing protein